MRKLVWILFISAVVLFTIPGQLISGVNFTFSDFLFSLAFLIVILENIFVRNKFLPLFNGKYFSVWIILMLLTVGIFLSAIFSSNSLSSLTNFFQYLFILIVLLSILEYLTNFKVKNYFVIVFVSIIPGVILSSLVLLSHFGLYNSLDNLIISLNGRYKGFEGLPTEFGNKMALYVTVSLFGYVYFKNYILKLLFLILSIIFSFVSLLSGSFGAVLILYTIVLIFLFFGFKKKVAPKILGITSLIFVVYQYYNITVNKNYNIIGYLPEIVQKRFITSGYGFGSIEDRLGINQIASQDFINSPLIGVGYGQYQFHNEYQLSVHNTILSAAVEIGLFGMLGVILYVVLPIILAFLLRKRFIKNSDYLILTNFLLVYSIIRMINTFKAQEYIDREPWIPILLIFILFSQSGSKKLQKWIDYRK